MSRMDWKREWKPAAALGAVFAACYWLPAGSPRFDNAVGEALRLVKWYAREHMLLCLVPAFFIAGAIGVFVSQASVMRYLGAGASKPLAYGVASVSGTVLAVCSCTVLPLFAGIYRMGAGLGPASAFLYAGPAINVLAIILTARILGFEIGLARAVGAVLFSVLIGLAMAFIHRREETARIEAQPPPSADAGRPLGRTVLYFALMVGVLVFANWADSPENAFWHGVWSLKWWLAGACAAGLAVVLWRWFGLGAGRVAIVAGLTAVTALLLRGESYGPTAAFAVGAAGLAFLTASDSGECGEWFEATWGFTKQIVPLLLIGVLAAGFLLGGPGGEGVIPSDWVKRAVGGNSIGANLFAAVFGAFMYFATLTEVPILQGLMSAGMGKGPALALLLAGPALSLPSMLVLRGILGTRKTVVFVALVIVLSALAGILFGALA
jgi:uncharacterized membrane protein YraQ (UPF0718 family)